MQKTLSVIGGIAIVIAAFYYLIFTPLTSYSRMEREVKELKKELNTAYSRVDNVYEMYDAALYAHLNDSTVKAIYSDTRFFEESEDIHAVKGTKQQ